MGGDDGRALLACQLLLRRGQRDPIELLLWADHHDVVALDEDLRQPPLPVVLAMNPPHLPATEAGDRATDSELGEDGVVAPQSHLTTVNPCESGRGSKDASL